MKRPLMIGLMCSVLAAGPVFAAEPARSADDADVEARLEAARERLEEAAREVARLSAEAGRPVLERFQMALEGEPPARAMIGVQLDPESGKEGARVEEVSPGGPAAQAGIRAGDVIVSVNGQDVRGENSARQVMRAMRDVEPESRVKVQVLRDGRTRDFEIVTRPMATRRAFTRALPVPPPHIDVAPAPGAFFMPGPFRELANMELATLSPSLGKYFGAEKGVLVVRAPESDAFKLQDGDVILSIDGREPTTSSHATRILRSYQPGEKLTMRIMRERKPMNLEVTIPERRAGDRRMRRVDEVVVNGEGGRA